MVSWDLALESTLTEWNIVQINFDKEEKQMRNGLENKDCMQVELQIGQLDSPDYPKERL